MAPMLHLKFNLTLAKKKHGRRSHDFYFLERKNVLAAFSNIFSNGSSLGVNLKRSRHWVLLRIKLFIVKYIRIFLNCIPFLSNRTSIFRSIITEIIYLVITNDKTIFEGYDMISPKFGSQSNLKSLTTHWRLCYGNESNDSDWFGTEILGGMGKIVLEPCTKIWLVNMLLILCNQWITLIYKCIYKCFLILHSTLFVKYSFCLKFYFSFNLFM